jgi:guanylate kinase
MIYSYPFPCLLLSGMPGTGKDTVSQKLVERDPSFVFFRKHRAGSPVQEAREDNAYLTVSPEVFQHMIQQNVFLQYHSRYGKMYGVSREAYTTFRQEGKIPVIHVGKYENLSVLRQNGLQEGLSILLWADRAVVSSRLQERHTYRQDGFEERLIAYDQEVAQLKQFAATGYLDFDLVFENNGTDPDAAAEALLTLLRVSPAGSKAATQATLSHLLYK